MEFEGVDVHQRNSLDAEMSTSGRGSILPAERSSIIGGFTTVEDEAGRQGRNAFEFPGDCDDPGGGDPDNRAGA
jgi:hypothetical protein